MTLLNILICKSRQNSSCKYLFYLNRMRIIIKSRNIYSYIIISFHSSAQFLEDARNVLGVPEWMLSIDSRKIKPLHNGACVQMLMHFKGPIAHQMELDLSRLIASGKLESPTLNIVGYHNSKRKKALSYRTCGVRDPNEKPSKWICSKSGRLEGNIDTFYGTFYNFVWISLENRFIFQSNHGRKYESSIGFVAALLILTRAIY